MKRARLPLTALRSFEVAGRHQSFTRAAHELFVSQAAISRQIRELEARLGVALFERFAQGVRLTTAGAELLAELTPAFDRLEASLTQSSAAYGRSDLALSVELGFASCWLMPRLGTFHAAYPDIELGLETDERVIAFRAHEPQLAIRFSATETRWKNAEARRIWDVTMIPVWAPGMPGADNVARRPENLLSLRLLHEFGERDWQHWCARMGIDDAGPGRGQRYGHQGLIMQAALNGQGVALVDAVFAAPYLATGELVTAFGSVEDVGAYWLVTPAFSKQPPAGRQFVQWLLDQLQVD